MKEIGNKRIIHLVMKLQKDNRRNVVSTMVN